MYNMFLHVSVALLLGSFCSASTISNPREDHEFQCSIDVYLREECNISTTNELECLSSGCCFSDDPYDAVKCYKKRKDTMTIKCEVQESSRKDCGYGGITPTRCEDLGCCFEASNMAGVPWCFYAKEEKNEKEESTKELKTSLINKFKSGLDSIFEQESLKPDTDNKVTSEEGVSDWLENLLDQISTITTGPVESPENFYGRPGEEINPKMVEDEKACMKTYELLLSVNGQFECEIYPIRRVECISGGLRLREDESECTACTKLGCCYDPEMKGSGTPHCYRGRPIVVSSALPTTTTTPAPTTNPRWSMLLNQLGIRPEESSASRNPFTTQNKSLWNQGQSSPWSQTSNLQPPVNFPGANQLQGAGSFEESLFHQINSQNGIGSSNNNFLNGLKPIQGDSNTQRPGIPNLASLLSGNSVTSGSSNTQRPGILNLASLLSGNSATTGGFNTQRPGIPSLASILSGNSASTGGSNTQRPEIPNLASLISGNSASTGGTNTQRPGIPNLASLLSSNTASTGGSNSKSSSVSSLTSLLSGNSAAGSDAKPSGLANLASILAGNSAPSSGSNTKQSSLFNLASILSGNSNGLNLGSTSSGSTKPAGLSNLTSMIFGNRVQTNREAPKSATPTPEQSKYLPDMFEYFGGSKPEQLCYPKNCGTLGEMHSQRTTRRIVGGQWTGGIDYWPWMASFRRNFTDDWTYKHVCGAALISERWILTAGHCFMLYRSKAEKVVGQKETNINAFTIHLGAYYRDIAELTLQVFALEKFIAHPEYDFRSLKHDIAVAKLLEPAVINNHVRPICLPFKTNMMEVGATTWVTGWGETLHVGDHNESKLKELPLPLISQYECKNHWKNHFHESWICTEGAYLEDACTGDSGGPLVRQGYDGRWKVVGVAIAGTKRCSTDRTDIRPGIYTNVAYYREFIDSATNGVCH
uniref:serine proteinase stubble-like isoform X2 n=1 Tax=Styela clava TaxID=7725 RepID=UPI00193977B7|nr:serine proteinase stubble-like isoform X2 [Styela clava]